ncbi:MAG: RHS repeat-associated core domain-containing protein [Treponema sp.]|nr:RHS repeat-associated core domain-containing protein [Treponema sp.]
MAAVSEFIRGNGSILEKAALSDRETGWGRGNTGDLAYYLTDEQGSVTAVTDGYGQVRQQYAYDAFGQAILGELGSGNDLGYNGKVYDPLAKLYNYGYRDYSPKTGRFTTVDPIQAGSNWYAYVNNDPMNFLDPLGLDPGCLYPTGNSNVSTTTTTQTTSSSGSTTTTTSSYTTSPTGKVVVTTTTSTTFANTVAGQAAADAYMNGINTKNGIEIGTAVGIVTSPLSPVVGLGIGLATSVALAAINTAPIVAAGTTVTTSTTVLSDDSSTAVVAISNVVANLSPSAPTTSQSATGGG